MELLKSITIFRALSDPSRLMIVNSLLKKEQYVEELAKRLSLSMSTISFHLKKLEQANLVYKSKEQYYTILHLNKDIFSTSLKDLISFENQQSSSQEERLKDYSQKVINTFFDNGRLVKFPAQYKKRKIILEGILSFFEKERIYTEPEVDAVIKKFYDDHCTIRRYFIDENMMFRKRGKYTLNEKYIFETSASEGMIFTNVRNESQEADTESKKMNERAKIKKQYKQTIRPMGIYQMMDLKNNKIYIGAAKNLDAIFNRLRFELTNGMHQITEVQNTWNKDGEAGIKMQVLDYLKPKEDPDSNYTSELDVLLGLWSEKLRNEGKIVFILNGTTIRKNI